MRTLTMVLAVVTAGFIWLALRGQDWAALTATLREQESGFLVTMAGLAFLANAAGLVAAMVSWQALLAGVGESVPATAAARIYYLGQLVKYVPGKVLGLALTVHLGRNAGVPAARMSAAWLLALVISLLTGATAGLLAGPEVLGGSAWWLLPAVVPVLAVFVRPDLLGLGARLAARVRRRPPAPQPPIIARDVRRAVLTQLAAWLIGGLNLWLLAVALGADPVAALPLCVGAFSLGAVAGVVAVFAPDGLGVREVVILAALSVVLPVPAATVAVLASRVVVALSELATAGLGLLVTSLLRRKSAIPATVS